MVVERVTCNPETFVPPSEASDFRIADDYGFDWDDVVSNFKSILNKVMPWYRRTCESLIHRSTPAAITKGPPPLFSDFDSGVFGWGVLPRGYTNVYKYPPSPLKVHG